jgi:hypothetical protein
MDILLPAEKDRQGRHPELGLLVVPVAVETVLTKLLQQQRRLWSMVLLILKQRLWRTVSQVCRGQRSVELVKNSDGKKSEGSVNLRIFAEIRKVIPKC